MKKRSGCLSALLLSAMLFLSCLVSFPTAALAQGMTEDGFYWADDGAGGVAITAYVGSATNLEIPAQIDGKTVTKIGDSALACNKNVWRITIPEGVTEIGTSAFDECHKLASISIPASVATIGDGIFCDCPSLKNIGLSSGNASFCLDGYGVLYDAGKTRLIASPAVNSRTSYAVPDTVTAIDSFAFNQNTALETITIPSTVASLGTSVFYRCTSLKSLAIPDGINKISNMMFWNCTSLESVTIPDSVTSIEGSAFYNCKGLKSVTLPDALEQIGSGAFGNTGLTSVTIPAATTSIDDDAFYGCYNISQITVGAGNPVFQSLDGVLYKLKDSQGGAIFALLQYPAAKADDTFIIPDGVTYLYPGCFGQCDNLTTVSIPESIEFTDPNNPQYGSAADFGPFSQCAKLSHFLTPGANNKFLESDGVLYSRDKMYLYYYPMTKTDTTFEVPKEVKDIRFYAFNDIKSLASFTVEEGNTSYFARDGVLYIIAGLYDTPPEYQAVTMFSYPQAKTDETLTVPATIEYPEGSGNFYRHGTEVSAISGNQYIKHVIYAPGTIGVGSFTFAECSNLETVDIPDGITSIGQCVFLHCPKLKSLTIPASAIWIEPSAFEGCTGLESITFETSAINKTSTQRAPQRSLAQSAGAGLESFNEGLFTDCSSLTSINIPDTVTSIGDGVFAGCDSLKSINVGADNKAYSSQDGVLYNKDKTALIQYPADKAGSTFTVPATARAIGADAFNGCRHVAGLLIPPSVTEIDAWSFAAHVQQTFTIYGTSGSYAQAYAATFGIPFIEGSPASQKSQVSFTSDAVTYATRAVSTGESIGSENWPENPAKTGYTFDGWFTGTDGTGTPFLSDTKVNADMTVYANWTINRYTVTFLDWNGATLSSDTVDYGGAATAPASPGRTGYTFTGWDKAFSSVTSDLTVTAQYSVNRYSITYNSQGGGTVSGDTADYGSKLTKPADPARTGYHFGGWYRDASYTSIWDFSTDTVASDTTLFARWNINSYTVHFDAQSGTGPADTTAPFGSRLTVPASPVRSTFDFTRWYKDAGCTVPWNFDTDTVTDNVNLYAGWAAQPQVPTLNGLSLSAGRLTKGFSPKTTSYTVQLGENEGVVSVMPDLTYDGSVLTMDGKKIFARTVSLSNGKKTSMTIKVTLGKKSTTYKLTIQRAKSTANALAALNANAGAWSQPFDPAVTSYTLTLPENVSKVSLKAVRASNLATVTPANKAFTLKNGQNVKATFKVKAQSGVTRTYTVLITRAKSTNANLASLKLNVKGMAPGFSPATTDYAIILPAKTAAVTITAKAADKLSKVTINGAKKTSLAVKLANGQTAAVTVTVTAQSGDVKSYVITVSRQ